MCEPAILLSLLWPLLSSSHNQGLAYSWGPGQYGPWRPCCLRVSPTGVARLVVAGSQWSEAVKNLARWFARVPRVSPSRWRSNVLPMFVLPVWSSLASSSRVLYASLQHTSNQTQNISVCACSKSYTHFNVCLSPPNHVWWLLYCPAC